MSGALPAGPLSDTERTDARRFLGYPAYGSGNSGAGFNGWRYFQVYGEMEYRLTNLSAAELVVLRAKLTEIAALDVAVAGAGARLSTDQAAVWHRNRDEVRDRIELFRGRCRELAAFLGVPPGPANSQGSSIAMVV